MDNSTFTADPDLERFIDGLVYRRTLPGDDDRNTSVTGNLHSLADSGTAEEDVGGPSKLWTSRKTERFADALVVSGSDSCGVRDIVSAPHRFSSASEFRGDAFHVKVGGRVLDTTFYSGGAFAAIPGLFEVTFEARPCVGVVAENKSMRVVSLQRIKCCTPTFVNITFLLCHVFDLPAKAIRDLLALGGYDCVADRLGDGVGPALSELDERNGIFDRPVNQAQDAPVIACTSLGATPTRTAEGHTVNKALHKFELVRWLLERAEELLDPGKITAEYRRSAFEAFYEQSALSYEERLKPKDLENLRAGLLYGTGYVEGHKWRPGPPLSLRFARHPLVVRFFGAGYFERLSQYHSVEWLSGLRVEEIYALHAAMLCTRADPGPPRYSQLYRQCFSSLLEERRSAGPSMNDYHDLVFLSYPHKNTERIVAVPARELSYDKLASLWCTGDRVRRVVTPAEVMDVFVYFVVQHLHYNEKHTCTHVRDVVHHCLFEMGHSAARSLVEPQKSAYNLTMPFKVAEREARAAQLRTKILDPEADPVRMVLDSLEALARVGVVCIDALAEPFDLAPFPIEIDARLSLESDGAAVVYLDRVHKIHRVIVLCLVTMVRCHSDRAMRHALPKKRRFFVEADARGWSVERQRSVATRLNRMTVEEVEAAVVGRMLGDNGLSESDLGTEHTALAGDVETPIYISPHEPCSEQRLAEHCIDTQAVTPILGAPGSGKSVVMSNIFRRYSFKKGEVVGLAFMGSHVNSLRQTIGIPDAPVLTVHQFLMCHARTCCNEPDLVDDARIARRRMAKREKDYPFFGPLCYPEPTYGECCCSQLHTVVLDEVGVMYEELFAQLLAVFYRCAPNTFCRLVIGGDLLQMPPINPGHIARELMVAYGCVPMEHGHRFDNLSLVKLGRAIIEGDADNIELDDGGESIAYYECSMKWRDPLTPATDPVNIVEGLYRAGTLEYLQSMVICEANALAAKLAHHIDSWYLLEKAKKQGKTAVGRLLRFYNKVEDGREASQYGRPLLWRGCFFPGQKIIFGRNVASMGLTNKEQLVIISIVEGSYVHLEDTALAALYVQLFGEVCKGIRELAGSVKDGDGDKTALGKLAAHYNTQSPTSNFGLIVRNHFYQGLKSYTKAQAEVQSLQGHALLRYEAMGFHRKEVHALKYGNGTGRSRLHRNPLCHWRRVGRPTGTDGPPQAELVEFVRRELQPASPEATAFLEDVVVDTLREVMSDLAVEADISYERATVQLDDAAAASVGTQISGRFVHPNHAALSVAVSNQYAERNMKDKKVGADDYIVFTPTASLQHTRAYGPGGKNSDTLRFMQCHALGDESKVVFIPIIKRYMDRVRSASAVTIYAAQGSSASKTAVVMPYPLHVEDFATASTRAEDFCAIVSNPIALQRTVERHRHARMSYLGAELRARCLIPSLRTGGKSEDSFLAKLRQMARVETVVARRPCESRAQRNLRVSAYRKQYSLVMPADQVLPIKCLGPNNSEWVLDKMQRVCPYLLFDRASGAPVNELVSAEDFDRDEYEYQYEPYDEADTMEGELSDSDGDMEVDD